MKSNASHRIIGLDMHPDVFAAAALEGSRADGRILWVQDRQSTAGLETWAKQQLKEGDVVVLEASGNSFEIAARLHALGHTALVLESAQAGKIRGNFCNDDRHSAAKLARVYASGLAKEVWQPDAKTRERREVFFAHRNAVRDATRSRSPRARARRSPRGNGPRCNASFWRKRLGSCARPRRGARRWSG